MRRCELRVFLVASLSLALRLCIVDSGAEKLLAIRVHVFVSCSCGLSCHHAPVASIPRIMCMAHGCLAPGRHPSHDGCTGPSGVPNKSGTDRRVEVHGTARTRQARTPRCPPGVSTRAVPVEARSRDVRPCFCFCSGVRSPQAISFFSASSFHSHVFVPLMPTVQCFFTDSVY